jgi:hypothetical protein
LTRAAELRFYFNGQLLADRDVSMGLNSIDIRVDLAQPRHSTLAWTCLPFPATGDRRWLGLPVTGIACHPYLPAAKTAVKADS